MNGRNSCKANDTWMKLRLTEVLTQLEKIKEGGGKKSIEKTKRKRKNLPHASA